MGFGSRLARGLLAGGADYFGRVADEQAKTRVSDAMLMREMALKRFEQGITTENADKAHGRSKDLATHQGGINAENTAKELGFRGILAAEDDKRTAVREDANDQREFEIWRKKQPIELQNTLTVEDFRQDRQDQRTAYTEDRQDNRSPVAKGVNATGDVVVGYPNNRVTTFQGLSPTPSASGGVEGIEAMYGRSGEPAPSASAVSAPAQAAPAANTYTMEEYRATLADAAMDPRFKGKSAAEVKAAVDQALKAQGLRLSTNGR